MNTLDLNLYQGEEYIISAIKHLFLPEMLFSMETANTFDSRLFKKYKTTHAGIIVLKGYKVSAGTNVPQGTTVIHPEYRIHVATPSEYYKEVAGRLIVSCLSAITAIQGDKYCRKWVAIDDVHTYHEPIFDNETVMLHCTVSHALHLTKPK